MALDHGNQGAGKKRKRKESGDHHDYPEVALEQLQMNTLRRYKRYYKLQTRQGLTKAQLAESVNRHFRSMPVNEKEALTYFMYMVKMNRNRLDTKDSGPLNSNNSNNHPDDNMSRESKLKSDHSRI